MDAGGDACTANLVAAEAVEQAAQEGKDGKADSDGRDGDDEDSGSAAQEESDGKAKSDSRDGDEEDSGSGGSRREKELGNGEADGGSEEEQQQEPEPRTEDGGNGSRTGKRWVARRCQTGGGLRCGCGRRHAAALGEDGGVMVDQKGGASENCFCPHLATIISNPRTGPHMPSVQNQMQRNAQIRKRKTEG